MYSAAVGISESAVDEIIDTIIELEVCTVLCVVLYICVNVVWYGTSGLCVLPAHMYKCVFVCVCMHVCACVKVSVCTHVQFVCSEMYFSMNMCFHYLSAYA